MTRTTEKRLLSDGTQLILHRNQSVTMKDKTKLTGDWMIALEPHRPRAVVFIFEQENRPTAKMIYDTHTLKHGENSNVPLPEKLDYVFYDIDDETEEKKYLEYRRAFDQQAA